MEFGLNDCIEICVFILVIRWREVKISDGVFIVFNWGVICVILVNGLRNVDYDDVFVFSVFIVCVLL